MKILTRRSVLSLSALALAVGLSGQASAQSFPDRPIRLIVPFGAGSAVDVIARAVATQTCSKLMTKSWMGRQELLSSRDTRWTQSCTTWSP